MITFGRKLKHLRQKNHLTQKELGIAMGFPENCADVRIAQIHGTGTSCMRQKEEDFPIALWHGSGIQTKILSFALEKKCICSRFIK